MLAPVCSFSPSYNRTCEDRYLECHFHIYCNSSDVRSTPAGLTTVMSGRVSARQPGDEEANIFRFHQPVPIPSYLMALATGDLVSRLNPLVFSAKFLIVAMYSQ